ncbi:hypothetical protein IGI04_036784, partial [Brassica rapa subsp. trilocularis]
IDGKFAVPFFFATPPSFSFFLLPLSSILLLSIYTDMLFSSGFSGSPVICNGNDGCPSSPGGEARSGSDLGVYGSSGMESVAALPGAFLTVLQILCRRFPIHWFVWVPLLCLLQVHDVEAIVVVYSVARSVSLHSSAFSAFGSGELLLFADRQGILGCPVVKPPWRLESLTFVVALAFSSSLPTWYVAGFYRFPTACFHTVKVMSLVRLAVVDSPGVGSVVCADAELGHLFRLMRLQPPCPRGTLIIRLL